MNPFKYGQVVSANDFCPRPGLMKQLHRFINSGQNVAIFGDRRLGKTSLIYEAIRQLKHIKMYYIDLMEIKATEDICKRIITSIISMEHQSGWIEKILKALSQFRPVVSIDSLTGQPTISISSDIKLHPNSIESLLDLIAVQAKNKKIVVVFDEFQDILNLSNKTEVLALLRSKIQFQSSIPYIFSGSIRNQMHFIFSDSSSPFFKSAATLEIGILNESIFFKFLKKKFALGKRTINKIIIDKIFKIAEYIPGDVQEVCSCLWEITVPGDTITEEHILPALELIFSRESKGYELLLMQLTSQQFKCLTGLAKYDNTPPFSADFLQKVGIRTPSSVQRAINRLVKLKTIYFYENRYKFVNPFLKSWLIWKKY